MVSRSDVLHWVRDDVDDAASLADTVTNADVFSAFADDLVGELADRMAVADIGRVPVIEHGSNKVIGLVARRDLLRVRASVVREERERRRVLRLTGQSTDVRGTSAT
jgi:predicted transcriptional regulator